MKFRKFAIVSSAAALMLSASAASAVTTGPSAQGTELAPEDIAWVEQQFETLGVDEAVREDLLNAIAQGDMPDSETGDVEAIETSKVAVSGGVQVRSVYPDGSVSLATVPSAGGQVQQPPSGGEVGPQSITCPTIGAPYPVQSGQSIWRGCTVSYAALTWSMSYTVDYARGTFGPEIVSARNPVRGGIGMGEPRIVIRTKSASPSGTASVEAVATQTQSVAGINVVSDVGARLDVTNSSLTVSSWRS